MQRNIGGIERGIRILIGVGITALALTGPKNPWAWLGLIPLVTGLVGWCPLYRLLRLSTFDEK
jgi:O-antigen ligase